MFSVSLMQLCLQKRRDFNLLIAVDGQSAWETALEQNPDLILMDINLPDTDGWQLSRRFRAHPLTHSIPIIAVTSLNRRQSIKQSEDAGINLHLNKTMINTSLIHHIDMLLSGNEF